MRPGGQRDRSGGGTADRVGGIGFCFIGDGVGVALVPQPSALKRWPSSVRAIDLETYTFHRDIGIVHRASGQLSEPALALAALLTQVAAAEH